MPDENKDLEDYMSSSARKIALLSVISSWHKTKATGSFYWNFNKIWQNNVCLFRQKNIWPHVQWQILFWALGYTAFLKCCGTILRGKSSTHCVKGTSLKPPEWLVAVDLTFKNQTELSILCDSWGNVIIYYKWITLLHFQMYMA